MAIDNIMTGSVNRAHLSYRFRVMDLMAVAAIAAFMLMSRGGGACGQLLFRACLLVAEFIYPAYLLLNRRGRTGLEWLLIVLGFIYMLWGGLGLFAPWAPAPYYYDASWGLIPGSISDRINRLFHPGALSRYASVWWLVRRWNWTLLSIFYLGELSCVRDTACVIDRGVGIRPVGKPRIWLVRLSLFLACAGVGLLASYFLGWIYFDFLRIAAGSAPNITPDEIGCDVGSFQYYAFPLLIVVISAVTIAAVRILCDANRCAIAFFFAIYWGFASSAHIVATPFVTGSAAHHAVSVKAAKASAYAPPVDARRIAESRK